MKSRISLVTHEDIYSLVSLPDDRADRLQNNNRLIECVDNEEEHYLSKLRKFYNIDINNILMFSPCNYLSIGISKCLEKGEGIKMKVIRNLSKKPIEAWMEEYNIVILNECLECNAGTIIDIITKVRKHNNRLKIMVISERSEILFSRLAEIWNGIWHLNNKWSLETFENTLTDMLKCDEVNGPELKYIFTSRQWQTLSMLSRGYKLTEVASEMEISAKTTSLHKKLALERVGASSRIHQAWVVKAIGENYSQ